MYFSALFTSIQQFTFISLMIIKRRLKSRTLIYSDNLEKMLYNVLEQFYY